MYTRGGKHTTSAAQNAHTTHQKPEVAVSSEKFPATSKATPEGAGESYHRITQPFKSVATIEKGLATL